MRTIPDVFLNGERGVELREGVIAKALCQRRIDCLDQLEVMLLVIHGGDPATTRIKERAQDAEMLFVCLRFFCRDLFVMLQ